MNVLILGTGKSGTTAMVYKVARALPDCHAFSGGKPGKYFGDYENAVYKHTYHEGKGKTFEVYREHLAKFSYDRKIWMARDPRDVAVSRMLYRWHKGTLGSKKQYLAHLDIVKQKEKDPKSISFSEICRYTGYRGWPVDKGVLVDEERDRYRKMSEYVNGLGDDWFLFKFEDMVAGKSQELNAYLGFDIVDDAEVPSGTGKAKVIRKKSSGDWRHWFTGEDVELLKPSYRPYMEAIGYDLNDWELAADPVIEPRFSSEYMQGLVKKARKNVIMRYLDNVLRRGSKRN
jgi:hypothetical protein